MEKEKLEIGNTLYGINNEIYTIEKIEDEQIVVKYYKKIYVTYNSSNNKEVQIKEEDIYFSFDDIGITIFFKEGDCYKNVSELFADTDYINYIKNLNNRIEVENQNERKRLQYIESLRPNTIKITKEKKDVILSSYSDDEKNGEPVKVNKEFAFFLNGDKPYNYYYLDKDSAYTLRAELINGKFSM